MFEMKDFSLEGKVALITGASYGIGFALRQLTQKQELQLYLMILNKN